MYVLSGNFVLVFQTWKRENYENNCKYLAFGAISVFCDKYWVHSILWKNAQLR